MNRFFLLLIAIILASEAGRIWWYSGDGKSWEGHPVLTWSAPPNAEQIEMQGTRAEEVLSYDRGQHVRFAREPAKDQSIEVFYLEYDAGNGNQWNVTCLLIHPRSASLLLEQS